PRAAAPLAEARAAAVAAPADLPVRPRSPRRRPRAAAGRDPPRVRAPPPLVVPRGALRPAAGARRGARDRRPARGAPLPGARADGRLHLRALPRRDARGARQLRADRARRVGRAPARLVARRRRLRLLQQRLGGVRAPERRRAPRAPGAAYAG